MAEAVGSFATMLRLVVLRPSSLAIAVLLSSLAPLLTTVSTLGINSGSRDFHDLTKELAIVGFTVGALRATAVLQSTSRSLEATAGSPGTWRRALVLAGSGSIHAAAAALPMLLLQGHAAFEPGLRVVPAFIAITALGCLLLQMDLRGAGGPSLLAITVLLGPMVLPQPTPARSFLLLAAAFLSAAWLLDHLPERRS